MVSIPQFATYFSYLFVIIAYTIKVVKVARMPKPLRWELYPVPHELAYKYGGSYYEEVDWWTKPRKINRFRDVLTKLNHYLTFPSYYSKNKGYWFGLFPWHTGFYTIVLFHILSAFSALLIVTTGLTVSAASPQLPGQILYYLTIVIAVCSFILGTIGSLVILWQRTFDQDLRKYATPSNYFNYIFFLLVFVSGLVAWLFFDPTLDHYRSYWKSVLTFSYDMPDWAELTHIMLFSLFLVYLPYTRSTHYITNLIAYFGILWNDTPNDGKGTSDAKLKELLSRPVSWSAGHIQQGKTWGEVVSAMPEDAKGSSK